MRAYVVGNAALDETFRVRALPASGESVVARGASRDVGGKGANQAILLARCGVPTLFVTALGTDAQGRAIADALAKEPVEVRVLRRERLATDRSIVTLCADGSSTIVTTTGCARSIGPDEAIAALRTARGSAGAGQRGRDGPNPGDWLVLQGNLTPATTARLLEWAVATGMRSAFNPSPHAPELDTLTAHADCVFVNEMEAAALTGRSGKAAALAVPVRDGGTVVMTRGGSDVIVARAGRVARVAVPAAPVVDPTGAGDTLQAVALAGAMLGKGTVDRSCLPPAIAAAALTVSRPGALASFPGTEALRGLLGRTNDTNPARGHDGQSE